MARCVHCLEPLADERGEDTPLAESLCARCYLALWGPKEADPPSPATERRRRGFRRPKRRSPSRRRALS